MASTLREKASITAPTKTGRTMPFEPREVDHPDVVRALGEQPGRGSRQEPVVGRRRPGPSQDALHAAARRLDAEAGQLARDPARAPARPLGLEAMDELADEVRQSADRREQRGVLPAHDGAPVEDRLAREAEDVARSP